MKQWTKMAALAAAAALFSGCASVAEPVARLADPATQYNDVCSCQEREDVKGRWAVATAASNVVGMFFDAAVGPLRVVKNMIVGVSKDAYSDTTAARNATCYKVLHTATPEEKAACRG